MTITRSNTLKAIILFAFAYSGQSWSLDTNIYRETILNPEPKILILLDTSGSMRCSGDPNNTRFDEVECARYREAGGVNIDTGSGIIDTGVHANIKPDSRMLSIKNILNDFIDPSSPDAWPDSFKVGLSVFSNPGSAVIRPIESLGATTKDELNRRTINDNGVVRPMTARDLMLKEIEALSGSGLTPTMGALFEAAMYMTSQPVVTATSRKFGSSAADLSIVNFPAGSVANWTRLQNQRIAHPDSFTGGAITPARSSSACGRAMRIYGPEYARFTDACADETVTAGGNLIYEGPQDNPQSCTDGERTIIMITDGFPTSPRGDDIVRDNTDLATWMNRFLNDDMTATGYDARCPVTARAKNPAAWECMRSIAKKLQDDHNTTLHIISFLADSSTRDNLSPNNIELKSIANAGGGIFYLAQSPEEIKQAINQISISTTKTAAIASPSITVDNFNPVAHSDNVYFSLFTPSTSNFWYGNLKRYKRVEIDGQPQIVARNNQVAINPATGTFNPNTQSFWSRIQDDGKVLLGGAAERLRGNNNVKIFTDFGSGKTTCKTPIPVDGQLPDIESCRNDLKEYFFDLAMQGRSASNPQHVAASNESANNWYKWLSGIDHQGREWEFMQSSIPPSELPPAPPVSALDANDYMRPWLGSVLHSSPFVINYRALSSLVDSSNNNQFFDRVFVSTNDGFLYGLAGNGNHLFRFFPEPLLKRIKDYTEYGRGNVHFGLDGKWTVWREDNPNNPGGRNGIIRQSEGDKVAVFGGMRRGGDYYYGLDLTSLDAPRLIFRIHGGAQGKQPSEPALARLGETWSQPELINVMINGKPEVLLAISGGHDNQYDAPQNGATPNYNPGANSNTLGNAIYLIYAEGIKAGSVAAWVSADAFGNKGKRNSDMRFAIPGRLSTLDLNLDGFVDHIYAADLAGQAFRIDIDNANTSANNLISRSVTLGKFGVTGSAGNNAAANNRRFYEGPSVALIEDETIGEDYVAVALVSGWRENPFDTATQDFMYTIRDSEPVKLLRGESIANSAFPLAHNDLGGELVNINTLTQADINQASSNPLSPLARAKALAMPLTRYGEKSFGRPLIVDNSVFFSTLIPSDLDDPSTINQQTCTRDTGDSRVYGIRLFTGQGALTKTLPTNGQTVEATYIDYTTINNAGDITVSTNHSGESTLNSGQAPVAQLPQPSTLVEKMHWRQMNTGSQVDRNRYYEAPSSGNP